MNFTSDETYYISKVLRVLEFGEWSSFLKSNAKFSSIYGEIDNLFFTIDVERNSITIEVRETVTMLDRRNRGFKNLYGPIRFKIKLEPDHTLYKYINNLITINNLKNKNEKNI